MSDDDIIEINDVSEDNYKCCKGITKKNKPCQIKLYINKYGYCPSHKEQYLKPISLTEEVKQNSIEKQWSLEEEKQVEKDIECLCQKYKAHFKDYKKLVDKISKFKKTQTQKIKENVEEKIEKNIKVPSSIILNTLQQKAYDCMVEKKNIFITGMAGVGKSEIINLFRLNYEHIRTIGVTSTTGISALLIGGTTLHSYLGIGLGQGSIKELTSKIEGVSKLKKRWKNLEVLIIDEISMLSPVLFDKLEEIARNIRKNHLPFGGIQLILSGDFLQLPTVGESNFCFESKKWEECVNEVVYLTENLRQNDREFQDVLSKIRVGNIDEDVEIFLKSCVGKELKNDLKPSEMVRETTKSFLGILPTKIYSTNNSVEYINNKELKRMEEDGKQIYSYERDIKFVEGISIKNKQHYLEKFEKNCNTPATLKLCIGVQVMLLYNLDVKAGLANGSRGVVVDFIDDIPVVQFVCGEKRIIDHHIWEIKEDDEKIMTMTQIPLKLAYAITCHKSQGATLDFAEINISDCFEFGQAYIALSRVKSRDGLSIVALDYDRIKAHPKAVEYYKNLINNV